MTELTPAISVDDRLARPMNIRNVLIALVIGLLAGWLASFVVRTDGGLLGYLISGVLGSFVGSFLLDKAGLNLGLRNEILRDIITATIGAVVVLLIARVIVG
jgi:uncharacterized membrane protein YeaQ/YmgE (transglycosylase-associated protein family)